MDINFEEAVATWLVADGRTLIAPQYPLRVGANPEMKEPVKWPDILAVRPKCKQIFLCEVTWGSKWSEYRKKIVDYRDHLDNIRTNLDHWLGIGAKNKNWRISIWYFVPTAHVGMFESHVKKSETMELEGGPDIQAIPLESIAPWNYTWGFREADVPKTG